MYLTVFVLNLMLTNLSKYSFVYLWTLGKQIKKVFDG